MGLIATHLIFCPESSSPILWTHYRQRSAPRPPCIALAQRVGYHPTVIFRSLAEHSAGRALTERGDRSWVPDTATMPRRRNRDCPASKDSAAAERSLNALGPSQTGRTWQTTTS